MKNKILTIPYSLLLILYFILTLNNKKPEREYITWNEFWKQKGYNLKKHENQNS